MTLRQNGELHAGNEAMRYGLVLLLCWVLLLAANTVVGQQVVTTPAGLKTALAAARPGDTVVIRNGTYRGVIWEVDATGTAEAPITVRAETPGKVISTGQSALRISGTHVVVEGLLFTDGFLPGTAVVEFRSLNGSKQAQHSRLTQCAIVNYSPANRSTRVHWVSMYGRHNRVDHNYFSGHNNNGVTLVVWLSNASPAPVYHRIDHNHFANRPEGGENGWETIRIGDSDTSLLEAVVTVEDNLFERCDGEMEVISNKSCGNIYRNNLFYETQGMLTLRHGDRCLVDGNWFLGNGRSGTGGIRVMGRDHVVINNYIERTTGRDGSAITVYPGVGGSNPPLNSYFPADRALIAFNTLVGVSGGSYIDMSTRYQQTYVVSSTDTRAIDVLPVDVVVANNVLRSLVGGSLNFVTGQIVASHQFAGNVVFGARPLGTTLPETGYRIEDPQLVQLDGVWQPADPNPLAGSAVGLYPEIATDIFGRGRSQPFDPGAFQTTGTLTVPRTTIPDALTTGPLWLDADRDLRVVTWPLRPDFFAGAAATIANGWLAVDWLGHAYVSGFPWVFLDDQQQWAYCSGPGRGVHWLHDAEWGWYFTDAVVYPWLYRADWGWSYYYGMADNGQRVLLSPAE
jgi:poly(beta-D-mannuronate) lyase